MTQAGQVQTASQASWTSFLFKKILSVLCFPHLQDDGTKQPSWCCCKAQNELILSDPSFRAWHFVIIWQILAVLLCDLHKVCFHSFMMVEIEVWRVKITCPRSDEKIVETQNHISRFLAVWLLSIYYQTL